MPAAPGGGWDQTARVMEQVLRAEKLVLLTNTPGVLDKDGNLLTGLTPKRVEELVGKALTKAEQKAKRDARYAATSR